MNRYLFKYTKTDNMKYISHLDLMNVLLRAFKRAKIALAYSQGFSPHPKISTAHPLSLGIESIGEYLEIELQDNLKEDTLLATMKNQLPEGIELLEIKKIANPMKSLAALVEYGEYDIHFICEGLSMDVLSQKMDEFLSLDEISIVKKSVKTHKEKVLDIKPLIHSIHVLEDKLGDNVFSLNTFIKTGSNGNLNPGMMMESIMEKCELNIDKDSIRILRKEMYLLKEEKMYRLIDII